MTKKETDQVKNICVLRLSAIGDVCNASAIVQEIQRQWPNVSITWIIGKTEFAVIKNLRGIEFIVFDKSEGIFAYFKLLKQLNGRRFDVLLHMQSALRASIASLCIRATRKIGFDRARAREAQWLFTNEKIAPQARAHVLEGFKGFALKLGLQPFEPRWDFPLETAAQHWADSITVGKPYVVLSASASKAERNWTVEYYSEIVRYITKTGFMVVLTCGPNQDEVNLARKIYIATERKVINLGGTTSLQELLALIKHAAFVISPDSGPAHMAAMLNTPVIGIYAHSNPQRTGPWRFREYLVSHYEANILQQKGQPASRLAWGVRARGEKLMQEIKPEEVIAKIKLLLKQVH